MSASAFEPVHTVEDYVDGPVRGVAQHAGRTCFYERTTDVSKAPDDDEYFVTPIDDALATLARESFAIWQRWDDAFRAGRVDSSSHPALPEDRPRFEEIERRLEGQLVTDRAVGERCRATFRACSTSDARLEVAWSPIR